MANHLVALVFRNSVDRASEAVEHAEVAAAAELQAEHQWRATYHAARRATGY